ncbi:MAG: Methionyl-tRNA formyltransferase [Chlamydiales bacterium]|nr:Methionyl-tRNA formyltransferase [Chlamydiales bacterium]
MRVVFFGTPDFAASILTYLIQQPVEIVAVVSRPDKAKGRSKTLRPTAVKRVAEAHGLPVFQPKKASDPEFAELLKTFKADLFVVAAYAEILRENILEIPPLGCLNVHGSLLPKYRGAAPVQRALMAGEKETGVSIMKMVLEMDAGDVYSMTKIPISLEMTAGALFEVMAEKGACALWKVMQQVEQGKAQAVPQDHSRATFTKKVKPEEGRVVWSGSALDIHNQIRGLTPNPGGWCFVEVRGVQKRLKLLKTRPQLEFSGQPGERASGEGQLIVCCGEGALELLEVQLEGKKALAADVFLRGLNADHLKF